MTTNTKALFAAYDEFADLIPAFKASAGQPEYDATLVLLPELIAADPLHTLSRLILSVVQELEQQAGVNARVIPAFDVPGQ